MKHECACVTTKQVATLVTNFADFVVIIKGIAASTLLVVTLLASAAFSTAVYAFLAQAKDFVVADSESFPNRCVG